MENNKKNKYRKRLIILVGIIVVLIIFKLVVSFQENSNKNYESLDEILIEEERLNVNENTTINIGGEEINIKRFEDLIGIFVLITMIMAILGIVFNAFSRRIGYV